MRRTSAPASPASGRHLRALLAAVVMLAVVLAQPAGARERSAFDAIPKATANTGIDSGAARLYSAAWGVPAGRGICSGVFADGFPSFGDPVDHLPLHPVDVTLWKSQKPSDVRVQGYPVIAGGPFGSAEDVPHELERDGPTGWIVRIDPVFAGDYLVTIDARWRGRSPCALSQEASWSLSLQTLTDTPPSGS